MKKIVFENFFRESKGQPILYNGKELRLGDKINLTSNEIKLKLIFISADSKWKQGIILKTKGEFEINGQKVPNKIVLWQHTAPNEIEFVIRSDDKVLHIWNVWDTGDGTMHYGHNGAAMQIQENIGNRIYNCNDGSPDDDLNDLVFRLEGLG